MSGFKLYLEYKTDLNDACSASPDSDDSDCTHRSRSKT